MRGPTLHDWAQVGGNKKVLTHQGHSFGRALSPRSRFHHSWAVVAVHAVSHSHLTTQYIRKQVPCTPPLSPKPEDPLRRRFLISSSRIGRRKPSPKELKFSV
ncbi:hypothetical protein VPH35_101237 [Triticum aestivum]